MPSHPSVAPEPAVPPQGVTVRFLVIVGVCGFASSLTMRILDPVMPLLAHDFDRTMVEVAMLSTWFTFSYAFGQPVLGPVGDSFGKARLMSIALMVVAACGAIGAAATSFGLFSLARGLTGIASGGVIPLAIAMIGDRAPLHQRQIVLARFMMTTLTGQIAGGLVSGALAPFIGWRGVVAVAACVALAAGVGSWIAVKPRANAPRAPFSFNQAIANYRAILQHPRAIGLYVLVAIEGATVFGFFPYVAGILKARDGAGSFESGVVVTGFAIGGLIFAIFAPKIVERLGSANMMRVGGDIIAISFALFAIKGPWWSAIAIFIGIGFGFYNLHNNLQAQATTLSETARGSSVALFACALFGGVACGPPLVGLLMAIGGDAVALLIYAALALFLGYIAPIMLKEDRAN
ncbi:MFS transporter [Terrarubrum flagellatum]|uniref:MFS transporter n=1 Tax=Terrirubrum flagellatum TaxID=2895980 RepID=UPI00314545D7